MQKLAQPRYAEMVENTVAFLVSGFMVATVLGSFYAFF